MRFSRNGRQGEQGNVLFLILIAIALFATLAYTITQSMRLGESNITNEQNTIDVAQILTVPSAYRAAVDRMVVGQGIDGGGIIATPPVSFSTLTADQVRRDIYHPQGGGMSYPLAPANLMDPDYVTSTWAFNSENEVKNIGTTTTIPDINSVDLMVFLPGLKKSVCQAINKRLGIVGPMPLSNADVYMVASSDPPSYMENGGAFLIGNTADDAQLAGKSEGCFDYGGNFYVFYAVILGR